MAVAALRRAVALSPKLADAHARIGSLLLSLSRRQEADQLPRGPPRWLRIRIWAACRWPWP